jgi:hypothetical protein
LVFEESGVRAPTDRLSTWVAEVKEERSKAIRPTVEKRLENILKVKKSAPAGKKNQQNITLRWINGILHECKDRGEERASPGAVDQAKKQLVMSNR